jgi:predicted deacylase
VQNEYREATSALGPQEQERSAKSLFANDVRPAASNSARAADARLRLAMVYYDRLRDLKRDKAIVEELAGHVGELPDPAALEAEIEETQSTGLALAEQATDKLLREARNLEQHYSVTAEIAAGYYLQSLFGNPELAEAAIRNYQTVIEGREDDPNVQAFVQRLAQLQNK